jgi:iron complex outermembrane recepter protein
MQLGRIAGVATMAATCAVGWPASCQVTASQPASAVQPASNSGLGEIIVTATRRNTNLQTTPIAVSAVDSSLIRQAAPRNVGDLSLFVPNFSPAKITGANAASFAMRGVGQSNLIVYYEPPVGVLVDDFVLSSVQTQLLDTFDVAQVEVLRGPQGTLFGKNTTGGAITVQTKKPELGKFTVEGRGTYGSFNTWQTQGAVNVPLVSDVLALRVVGSYEKGDGFNRDGYCYGPITPLVPSKYAGATGCGDGARIGGTKVFSGRAKLLFQPSSAASILLQYEILRDHSAPAVNLLDTQPGSDFIFNALGATGAQNSGGDPLNHFGATFRTDNYMNGGRDSVDVDGVYLNANFDMGFGTLTNVTGYRSQRTRTPQSTSGDGPIVAADGSELSLFDINRADNRNTFQEELRFASHLGGKFDFVSGLFFQHETIDFCVAQTIGFLDLTGATTPYGPYNNNPYVLCNDQKSDSTAAYTEATWKITDKLTLTAGARYTWEDKLWRGRQQAFVPDITGDPTATWQSVPLMDLADFSKYPDGVISSKARAAKPTWRGSVGYKFTPDIYAYATYSRGFKGGGFNDQTGTFAVFGNNLAAFQEAAAATKPETADSYEAGIKTQFFDHHLRLNLTGFYVKYKNLQKQIVVPLEAEGQEFQVTRFFNAASADVKGVEAELTVIPITGLTIHGNLSYQDGHYINYVTPIPAGYNLATAPLDRTPKWQWATDAIYQIPIGDRFKAFVDGNVQYTGKNLFEQSITAASENAYLDKHMVVNGSVGFSGPNDGYTIRLIGRNLTDKRYKTATIIIGGLFSIANYAPPRSWALEGSFKF